MQHQGNFQRSICPKLEIKRFFEGSLLWRPSESRESTRQGRGYFKRGKIPLGVFYIQEGIVELSPTRNDCQIAHEVAPGSILGLGEVLKGQKYEAPAICRSLTRVIYVEKDELLRD